MTYQLIDNATGGPVTYYKTSVKINSIDWLVVGGIAPLHSGSTGRIHVQKDGVTREYFPQVANCKWEESQ